MCAGPREVKPGGDWKEAATEARGEGERGALDQMRSRGFRIEVVLLGQSAPEFQG